MRHSTVTLIILAACSGATPPKVATDRPNLLWTEDSATKANAAALPAGFTSPAETACAQDTTRQYLGELFVDGISNPQVLWHWAPVVGGPQASLPTLQQPEFSLAGTLAGVDDSNDDVLADHPFGTDVDGDVMPDADFAFLPFEHDRSTLLHTEVENRIVPRAALGYTPAAGDRTLMRGAWILDCGHPPYGAEMHPPTFAAYARSPDANTTIAAVVVTPYRSSLLFTQDKNLATALDNTARFTADGVKPFPLAMVDAVEQAVLLGASNVTTHALMIANRFDTLDFLVCAPSPRPAGKHLSASWRLTARTGVTLTATAFDAIGCARFVAKMDSTYTPMPLAYDTTGWSWQELSDSASGQLGYSIDVRQQIVDALSGAGFDASQAPALQPDHPPMIDAYAALATRAGADQDSPAAIVPQADDQPFPFYGRVRAEWK